MLQDATLPAADRISRDDTACLAEKGRFLCENCRSGGLEVIRCVAIVRALSRRVVCIVEIKVARVELAQQVRRHEKEQTEDYEPLHRE
jgi:hypothetical protein